MGIRYSGGPIRFFQAIRSDSAAHMIIDIDTVLSPCALAKASVTGGFKYTLESPDGLQMKLWVQDLGDHTIFATFIRMTPTSADELLTGVTQVLILDGRTYEAWANCCQFFIAPLADSGSISPVSFACGIPALPLVPSPTFPTVTDLWWSSSSGNGAFSFAQNFRDSRYALGSFSICINAALYNAAGNTDLNTISLAPMCSAFNVDVTNRSAFGATKYGNGDGLRIDALLTSGQFIYGQFWDAHLLTIPATAIDEAVTLTELDSKGNIVTSHWIAWNYSVPPDPNAGSGTILATLFLLSGISTESLANIAY